MSINILIKLYTQSTIQGFHTLRMVSICTVHEEYSSRTPFLRLFAAVLHHHVSKEA